MANILVLDTNPVSRRFVVALLRNHGHAVREVGDAAEALTLVREECPDLLIVDIAAPDMDGCRFVVQMRCEPRLPQPRVLMRAVAGVEAEARALAHAFGASFVVKPTNPELLLATVSATVGEPAPPQRGPPADGQPGETMVQPIARLLRRVAERSAQLEVARTALDLEIKKRIWAEHDLIHATQRLDDRAVRDPVTGLYNRRFLEESLSREGSRARRHGQPLALMMFDVDHFREFNDTLGHTSGDAILKSIGQCIVSLSRGEDLVARYGGDEFALMMMNVSEELVWQRAELIRQRARSLEVGGSDQQLGPVTLSVGIAIFPDHGDGTEALLKAADEALARAKRGGRNRVAIGERTAAAQEPAGAERRTAVSARGAVATLPVQETGDAA
ncbi:MAG: diguanylate cyclase [Gammaproteobacteria bacterium]|nr:MAG: diguanylate cyclase [Gammaproteobacteria bacterium]